LLVKKFTLLIDPQWEKELIEKFYNHVEAGEVFQLLDETEVEVCDDCQIYLTTDETHPVMEIFKCYDNQNYCLNCCGCEDHVGEKWY
jgi:hypothetical protein